MRKNQLWRNLSLWTAGLLLTPPILTGCEEDTCPINTQSFAHFDFVDEATQQPIKFSEGFDVTGFIIADVTVHDTLPDGTIQDRLVKDSVLSKTLYNKAETSLSLPLSYTHETTYVLHYTEKMRDTIVVTHRNIPYLQNIECGTMMFYEMDTVKYTTYNLRSIEIVNKEITNEEKQNFKINYIVSADQ